MNDEEMPYLVPSRKPHKPAGYWSERDKFFYTMLTIALTTAAIIIIYIAFSVFNIEQSQSKNKWFALTKYYEFEYHNAQRTIDELKSKCSQSR